MAVPNDDECIAVFRNLTCDKTNGHDGPHVLADGPEALAWASGAYEDLLPCLDAAGSEGWRCITHDGTGLWCDHCVTVARELFDHAQ